MLPQFQMVRDFDLYETQPQEYRRFSALIFHKEEFMKETQENQFETGQFSEISRSLKKKTDRSETSFESNYLRQHLLSFEKISKEFLDNCYPQKMEVQTNLRTAQIFGSDPFFSLGKPVLRDLIIKDGRLFEEKQKKQFLADLYFEEKLSEFLNEVCSNCSSEVALELAYIANLVWKAYIPSQEIGLSEEEISSLIDNLLTEQSCGLYLQKVEYLNLKKAQIAPEASEEQVQENLKTFLRKFGTTILLVVEEYFRNPFSKFQESNSTKRAFSFKDISNDSFSDDEGEYNFMAGNKKRKL